METEDSTYRNYKSKGRSIFFEKREQQLRQREQYLWKLQT